MRATAALIGFLAMTPAAARDCPAADPVSMLLPPVEGAIVSDFGFRHDPSFQFVRLHTGVDYEQAVGGPVRAAAAGRVQFAGRRDGYGKLVTIRHGNGHETRYAHLSAIEVRRGRCVQAGVIIGRSGSNERGALLHFEVVVNGRFVNPRTHVANR